MMDDFYTLGAANEGVRIPLSTPSGVATDHWLLVLGRDSDTYRREYALARRRIAELASGAPDSGAPKEVLASYESSYITRVIEIERGLIARLIIDWSFDQECDFNNVVEFLTKAPQIADTIDTIVGSRKLFFARRSSS